MSMSMIVIEQWRSQRKALKRKLEDRAAGKVILSELQLEVIRRQLAELEKLLSEAG
jgi:hypothetical protein